MFYAPCVERRIREVTQPSTNPESVSERRSSRNECSERVLFTCRLPFNGFVSRGNSIIRSWNDKPANVRRLRDRPAALLQSTWQSSFRKFSLPACQRGCYTFVIPILGCHTSSRGTTTGDRKTMNVALPCILAHPYPRRLRGGNFRYAD